MPATDSTAAIEAAFRIEFPRVVAVLASFVGDLDLAEELAQDALVDALRQWPTRRDPGNPGAWLTAVAKRKAIDRFRRDRTLADKYAESGSPAARPLVPSTRTSAGVGSTRVSPEQIDDDRLRLIFVACHPVLSVPARVALDSCGSSAVSRCPRSPGPTWYPTPPIAQRIVRAKKSIATAGVPFEVPVGEDRTQRLHAVLEVIYLIYNEGYAATAGPDWMRPELCYEALRLGRNLTALAAEEPEVHGLVALMEFQSSRLQARTGPSGEPVLLLEQDRRRWDRLHIGRGEVGVAASRHRPR